MQLFSAVAKKKFKKNSSFLFVLKKSIREPQYTILLCPGFYDSNVIGGRWYFR